MEIQSVCKEFRPHPFRKICENCRNPKVEHELNNKEDHQIRLSSLLESGPDDSQKENDEYAWIPKVYPPVTIESYFAVLPEAVVPKRGTEGEKQRWKLWRFQVPLQDVSEDHCRFIQSELKETFAEFRELIRKNVFDFGYVQKWSRELPIQCATCLMLIEDDELVVMSPKNALCAYHPKCFVCSICKEHLVDLAHCFEMDGNIYCERHFAERHKKRCQTCDELLFCFRYAQSCDKFYHKDHLLCFKCDEDLTGSGAFEKEGELYCSKCYENLFCYDCNKCTRRISIDDKHVSFKESHWHSDCFQCEICKESLTAGPFELHDGHYYCCKCFETHYAPRCDGCNQVFDAESKVLKYQGATFHIACFKCGFCSETIGTGSFIPKNSMVYCKKCYMMNFGIRCAKCHELLSGGKGITYKKVPYHPDCFTCHKCETQIGGKPFKNVDNNCYCMDCYGQDFCDKCYSCGEPILLGAEHDVMYAYDGKKYHEHCFVCSMCHAPLADVPITYHEKMLLCSNCDPGESSQSQRPSNPRKYPSSKEVPNKQESEESSDNEETLETETLRLEDMNKPRESKKSTKSTKSSMESIHSTR